jgi:hypothetical protein
MSGQTHPPFLFLETAFANLDFYCNLLTIVYSIAVDVTDIFDIVHSLDKKITAGLGRDCLHLQVVSGEGGPTVLDPLARSSLCHCNTRRRQMESPRRCADFSRRLYAVPKTSVSLPSVMVEEGSYCITLLTYLLTHDIYEGVSNILRTDSAIYTAVVARSTGIW